MAPTKINKSHEHRIALGKFSHLTLDALDKASDPVVGRWAEEESHSIVLGRQPSAIPSARYGTVTPNIASRGYSLDDIAVAKVFPDISPIRKLTWRTVDFGEGAARDVWGRRQVKPINLFQWTPDSPLEHQMYIGVEEKRNWIAGTFKNPIEMSDKFGAHGLYSSNLLQIPWERSIPTEIGGYAIVVSGSVLEYTSSDWAAPVIQAQDDIDTILHKLEQSHFMAVAKRIRFLRDEIDEEEGENSINVESLRRFADFILSGQLVGSPSTWIDYRGFLGLEWRILDPSRTGRKTDANTEFWGKGDGILAMVFLPSGLIRFSGTSGPVGQGIERLNVSGAYPPSEATEAVQPFLSRVESR